MDVAIKGLSGVWMLRPGGGGAFIVTCVVHEGVMSSEEKEEWPRTRIWRELGRKITSLFNT